jgi:hypothetical protein
MQLVVKGATTPEKAFGVEEISLACWMLCFVQTTATPNKGISEDLKGFLFPLICRFMPLCRRVLLVLLTYVHSTNSIRPKPPQSSVCS